MKKIYSHLLEGADAVLLLIDQSLTITFSSPSAASGLGLSADHLTEKPLFEVLPFARGGTLDDWLTRLLLPTKLPALPVELSLTGKGKPGSSKALLPTGCLRPSPAAWFYTYTR